MASLVEILSKGPHQILAGEVTGKSEDRYTVNLRDRTVAIKSLLDEEFQVGTHVLVTNVEKELYIINRANVRARERKEVLLNG